MNQETIYETSRQRWCRLRFPFRGRVNLRFGWWIWVTVFCTGGKGLPFIILKPVQREPERRDNGGGGIVSLSNGVKTAMAGTIMPLSEKVVYPFLSTRQKLRAFILLPTKISRRALGIFIFFPFRFEKYFPWNRLKLNRF